MEAKTSKDEAIKTWNLRINMFAGKIVPTIQEQNRFQI